MNYDHFKRTLDEGLDAIQPCVERVHYVRPKITVNGMAEALSEYLHGTLLARSFAAERDCERTGITLDKFKECVKWAFEMRIAQVSHEYNRTEFKRTEYPACLYPLLEMFGRYVDESTGLDIRPDQPMIPSQPTLYTEWLRILKTHGIPVAKGLPVVVSVDSTLFYRLQIKDGEILVAGDVHNLNPAVVLARCFYDMSFIQLFGSPRYTLGHVSLQASANSLGLLAKLGLRKELE